MHICMLHIESTTHFCQWGIQLGIVEVLHVVFFSILLSELNLCSVNQTAFAWCSWLLCSYANMHLQALASWACDVHADALHACLFVCLFVCLSIYLSACLSICLCVVHLFICSVASFRGSFNCSFQSSKWEL